MGQILLGGLGGSSFGGRRESAVKGPCRPHPCVSRAFQRPASPAACRLKFLCGHYDRATGEFHAPNGRRCVYFATDNLHSPAYRRLTPEDLIDIAVEHDLHFDQTRLEGVTFSLIGALSEFGKLGAVSIAEAPERALDLYRLTVDVLDRTSA